MRKRWNEWVVNGFSNEQFLSALSRLTGVQPVGDLGRTTPLDVSSVDAARGSLLLREVFSKYDDGLPSKEKEDETWRRFYEAETLCEATNRRVSAGCLRTPFWANVRFRISAALGRFSWDACAEHFAWGPGSTTRIPYSKRFAAYKYSGTPECTPGNAALGRALLEFLPAWKHAVVVRPEGPCLPMREVMGNSIVKVPKSYKTDRTIAKEPCLNIYVQKGIGRVIRTRLKSVNVDLDDQTRNQKAALLGSLDGSLATIDMSMASDTLAFELVSNLLPNDWWYALGQCRSPFGALPSGELIRYQKFSSMGNGYTFELESLIFWAICQEVCSPCEGLDYRVCVYGDDLVVPTEHFETVVGRLQEAGFKTNSSKTFGSGPYRESCGKHFWKGHDITPFYIKKPTQGGRLDRLFLVHNNLARWCERSGLLAHGVLKRLRELAPSAWRRPRLPDGVGDGAFIGPVDLLRLDSHPHGWEYWQVKVLAVSKRDLLDELPVGQIVASLIGRPRSHLLPGWFDESQPFPAPSRAGESSQTWDITEQLAATPIEPVDVLVETTIHLEKGHDAWWQEVGLGFSAFDLLPIPQPNNDKPSPPVDDQGVIPESFYSWVLGLHD